MTAHGRSGVAPPLHVAARRRAAAIGSDRRFLAALCWGVVLIRASYVLQPLRNDEGGYLLVARHWSGGGPLPYGDWFVDRPPLLLAVFRLAAAVEWDGAIRVIAVGWALAFVVAAAHAGRRLGGRTGGRWAAVAGAAAMCSPALAADQAEGELFAAVLVMVALALGLAARDAPAARRRWLAAAAGAAAGAAPLVKQSALEGLLALAVVAVVVLARRSGPGRRVGAGLVATACGGVLVPVLACAAVVVGSGADPLALWRDLVQFRGAALDVIWSHEPRATIARAGQLVAIGVVTGLVGCVLAWSAAVRATLRGRGAGRPDGAGTPEHLVITALVGYGLVAIVAGGSYWPSYGLQVVPALVLAVAVVAPGAGRPARWMRTSARMLAATAVVGSAAMAVVYAAVPAVWFQQRTGEWLAASAEPGDTAVVTYGHPSILEAADLPSPYPYLWSVPVRTLDPDLDLLRATLAGDRAPTWFVEVNTVNSWGIDAGGRLRELLERRYRVVAEVCGNPVRLRRDLDREPVPVPSC